MPGEFDIIERYFRRSGVANDVRVGIGDDAAIIAPGGDIAVAVDTLVAGVHFPDGFSPHSTGHRALAVNLSDLAAMGARPRWATLALCLPAVDVDWLEGFSSGFHELAERYEVSLIGGDTTRGQLAVTVTILGEAAGTSLLRSGAAPGDRIVVTGTLGDAAAGLRRIVAATAGAVPQDVPDADHDFLVNRFSYPVPRVEFGLAMAAVATAAIDVSDGLLADLGHVIRQSGCGAQIDLEALPLSAALLGSCDREQAEQLALTGGDDYELCLAVPAAALGRAHEIAAQTGTALTEIGEFVAGSGITGRRGADRQALDASGFQHF